MLAITEEKRESAQRLRQVVEYTASTQREFAKKVGVKQATIGQLVAPGSFGTRGMSKDLMVKISKAYPEISYEWLRTGKGEMIITKKKLIQNQKNLVEITADMQAGDLSEATELLAEILEETKRNNVLLQRIAETLEKKYPV